jgi:hypothetical protein
MTGFDGELPIAPEVAFLARVGVCEMIGTNVSLFIPAPAALRGSRNTMASTIPQ